MDWDNLFEEAKEMQKREQTAQEEMDKLIKKMIKEVENDGAGSIQKEDIVVAIIGLYGVLKTSQINNLF